MRKLEVGEKVKIQNHLNEGVIGYAHENGLQYHVEIHDSEGKKRILYFVERKLLTPVTQGIAPPSSYPLCASVKRYASDHHEMVVGMDGDEVLLMDIQNGSECKYYPMTDIDHEDSHIIGYEGRRLRYSQVMNLPKDFPITIQSSTVQFNDLVNASIAYSTVSSCTILLEKTKDILYYNMNSSEDIRVRAGHIGQGE